MDCQHYVYTTFWTYLVDHPEAAGIFLSALLLIPGWYWNERSARNSTNQNDKLARELQRKQLAVQMLFSIRENTALIGEVLNVFEKMRSNNNYDWGDLARRRHNNQVTTEEDRQLCKSLINVLNHMESLSIAILNESVDEEILKLSQRLTVTQLHGNVHGFITENRRLIHNNRAWCQFQKLAERWAEDVPHAGPHS